MGFVKPPGVNAGTSDPGNNVGSEEQVQFLLNSTLDLDAPLSAADSVENGTFEFTIEPNLPVPEVRDSSIDIAVTDIDRVQRVEEDVNGEVEVPLSEEFEEATGLATANVSFSNIDSPIKYRIDITDLPGGIFEDLFLFVPEEAGGTLPDSIEDVHSLSDILRSATENSIDIGGIITFEDATVSDDGFTIFGDDLSEPIDFGLVDAVTDQIAPVGQPYSFTLPVDSLLGVEPGEILSYSATQADGSPLPDWLSFDEDPSRRTFSGTPTYDNVGTLEIELTVETSGAIPGDADQFTSDTFFLTVPGFAYAFPLLGTDQLIE